MRANEWGALFGMLFVFGAILFQFLLWLAMVGGGLFLVYSAGMWLLNHAH